jgi:8-oxo-dGTP diphosphatase
VFIPIESCFLLTLLRMPAALPIPVVCAVLEDGTGRVLVAQRPAHKHLGLKWEFAGGKVEPGEQPDRALIREMHEELGCDIRIAQQLARFTHDYGDVVIEMIPFICALKPGSPPPHPHEHVAIRWIAPAELKSLDLAPADWPVVESYIGRSKNSGVHPPSLDT